MENFSRIKKNGGQAMLISIVFFLFISTAIISGLVSPSVRDFKIAADGIKSKQSFFVSESALEDSYYRLKNNINIGTTDSISLNGSTASATISNSGYNQKTISSLGDTSARQRTNQLTLNTSGNTVNFSFAVQTGQGGLVMANNSGVNGSVYANGPIVGSNGAYITNNATSADSVVLYSDQSNLLPATPASSITFGDTTSTQDLAQSFQMATAAPLNKIQIYMKKVGGPSNITMNIVTDSNGSPSTTVLASAIITASSVSTSYGLIDIVPSPVIQLATGTTYWIVLDTAANASKYYIIGANTSYANGSAKIGTYGGTWSAVAGGLDSYFSVYLGGYNNSISSVTVGTGSAGDAWSGSVTSSTVRGNLYCNSGSGNNKSCNTSKGIPPPAIMPITDTQIATWKAAASSGGVINGNYTVSGTNNSLGPKEITGNLSILNGGNLKLTGTIWVHGNISMDNNAIVSDDTSFGSSDGNIIADGTISLSNNASAQGSGTSGSFVMLLTTSSSQNAISLANNGGSIILYAPNGNINLSNNAVASEIVGFKITFSNNASLVYNSGLIDTNFVSGAPAGGWGIKSWGEI